MPTVSQGAITVEVDDEGFLVDPAVWNDKVAAVLATTEGLGVLTDEHWKIINYIREYFDRQDAAPTVRKLCQDTGIRLKRIYALFPSGPSLGACKVAGLRKPDGCV